jgi:hypothetical protein
LNLIASPIPVGKDEGFAYFVPNPEDQGYADTNGVV